MIAARLVPLLLLLITIAVAGIQVGCAEDAPSFTRQQDVIYGRKDGMALTLDLFRPRQSPNGASVVAVVSGGWVSSHDIIDGAIPAFIQPFLQRGYTVFAVVTSSQPKYTIPEILPDVSRAVRFIRHHAKEYGVSPQRLGIYGLSAGGHLSLMQGLAGEPGDPSAKDPVDRESARLQAVAAFFPPTDFLNYGKEGENALTNVLADFRAAFDFRELDARTKTYVRVTARPRVLAVERRISPITHVGPDDPPTLLIHGDADTLVPLQQSRVLLKKLQDAGVEAKLIVKSGGGHGWPDIAPEVAQVADWFDAHLRE